MKIKKYDKKIFSILPKDGFALLFTVLIVSIVLTLTLTIVDISYRQSVLSGLAKDSQIAFYQADAGLECGLYYDVTRGAFPRNSALDSLLESNYATITCGGITLSLQSFADGSNDDYFIYTADSGTFPCVKIIFDKSDPIENVIEAHGYNECTQSDRQVERTLKVTY